jgi:deoxyribonuclease V
MTSTPGKHRWDVSTSEAIAIQRHLRDQVLAINSTTLATLKTIAGVDVAYQDKTGEAKAAVVVQSFPELEIVEQAVITRPISFPYVPGLLSFREAPAVLDAVGSLRVRPDLLMCDGQGYAHPRRVGLATHLGIYLDMPSVGCAKSRLIGSYDEPGPTQGSLSPLTDHGEVIGMVLRSKTGTRPLFISIGHMIELATAVDLVKRCLRGYRLPEPTRLADKLSKTGAAPTFWHR